MKRKKRFRFTSYESIRVGKRVLKVSTAEYKTLATYAASNRKPIGKVVVELVSQIEQVNPIICETRFTIGTFKREHISAAVGVIRAATLKEIITW